MPYLESITDEKFTIGFWKLDEPSDILLQGLELTDDEMSRFRNFTCERRKREFLASRIILNELTGGTLKIVYDELGRPSSADSSGYISLSHSGSLAAVILSGNPTGIDVEEISRNIERIMPRFLSEEEMIWVQKTADRHLAALVCWCAKEAVFKMMHQEGVDFRRHIHLQPFDIMSHGSIMAQAKSHKYFTGIKLKYQFLENNAVVWCVE